MCLVQWVNQYLIQYYTLVPIKLKASEMDGSDMYGRRMLYHTAFSVLYRAPLLAIQE